MTSRAIKVAIVEDDPLMLSTLSATISAAEDMAVMGTATTVADGRALIDGGGFDVFLCDLGLPDGNGLDLIRHCAGRYPSVDIMVITLFAEQRKVLECIRAGAKGYLHKDQEAESCVDAIREIQRGGSPISPVIARQLLLHIKPQPQAGDAKLSEREREILNMLARGFSKRECADLLNLSVNTVSTHVKNIYAKLEVNSRTEALFEASSQGIIG
ncbi:response regulator [Sphingorhabdus sp.]|jgi:DNA-binding NarL/FixJ family response regulator|uniref:response regulator n=1 Tax=Sphingorhabdus sp. TaxID=1902408 RepID=UPI003BB0A4E1|nr:response regulator transcription factor [Sphingomonadales bacterium]MBK9432091.1 response regulator transcription factor [Sphingomonadales bacterium]